MADEEIRIMITTVAAELAARIERNFKVMPTLTLADTAKEMGLSQLTVMELCKTGKLPHMRVGKFYRIKPADINAYLESTYYTGRKQKGAEV